MDEKEKQTRQQTKKPYAKPEVVYQQPLEVMAAACTPVPPGKSDPLGNCTVLFS